MCVRDEGRAREESYLSLALAGVSPGLPTRSFEAACTRLSDKEAGVALNSAEPPLNVRGKDNLSENCFFHPRC